MNYSVLKPIDVANGPGCRVSLFVSGCRNRCEGCFQPETWDFNYGERVTNKTEEKIFDMLCNPQIKGLSILGGDPFEPENIAGVYVLCKDVKERFPEKTIWVWTGYLWEDIISTSTQLVMKYIDVLVDGPFIESRKNLMLPYCGSDNQRVIDVQKSLQEGAVRLWWDPEKSYDIFNMGRPFITKKED